MRSCFHLLGSTLVAVGLIASFAPVAGASDPCNPPCTDSICLSLVPGSPTGSGPFTYAYDAQLASGKTLVAGSFFTVAGFQGFTGTHSEPAGWSFSADSAAPPNLTWTYVGPFTLAGPIDLGLFTADSSLYLCASPPPLPGAGNSGNIPPGTSGNTPPAGGGIPGQNKNVQVVKASEGFLATLVGYNQYEAFTVTNHTQQILYNVAIYTTAPSRWGQVNLIAIPPVYIDVPPGESRGIVLLDELPDPCLAPGSTITQTLTREQNVDFVIAWHNGFDLAPGADGETQVFPIGIYTSGVFQCSPQ